MSRRITSVTRLSLLVVPVLVLGLLSLFGSAAQAAVPLGGLLLSPGSGVASSPISMVTVSSGAEKGCPAPSTNVVGYITGPGGWSGGILGVQKTSIGVSQTEDFGVDLADSFAGIATSNSVALVAGRYTITVYCQAGLGTTQYGEFSAPVWFTDATHYQTTDPSAPVVVTTTTALTTTPASSAAAGAPVTLTATVTPAAAAGTIQFTDTAGAATVNIGSPVTVIGGTATATTTTLAAGSHSLAAVFTPASPAAFTSSTSAARAFSVTPAVTPPATTSTNLTATPASGAKAGDPVTLLAGIMPIAATGTIQITDRIGGTTTNVGAPVTVSAGSATVTTSALTAAAHSLTAVFTPANAASYVPSTSSALAYLVSPATVPPAATTTALTVNPAGSADAGTPVILRAVVAPGSAAGSVQFRDTAGGTTAVLGQPVAVTAGAAELATSSLAGGAHSFVAVFIPADAGAYAGSQSPAVAFTVTQRTPPVSTSVALAANPASPSALGAPVTFTASVAPAAAAGTVTFIDAGATTPIGSTPTIDGAATVTSSTLAAGSHTITATFVPLDPSAFLGSASSGLGYSITAPPSQPVSTSTSLSASPNGSAVAGAQVGLTATVSPANAAGTVQFTDTLAGTTSPLGAAVAVKDGTAALTTSVTALGDHQFGALFTPADTGAYAASAATALAYQITSGQNPEATPTSTYLYGWPTWFCPRAVALPMQKWGDRKHVRFNCRGAVLVARVTPRQAAGGVVFTDTTGSGEVKQLGGKAIVQDGWALTLIAVTPGKHTYAATFVPDRADQFQPSASNEIPVTVR